MTLTDAHKLAAKAVGEMSLAIVRRQATQDEIKSWADALYQAAAGLEKRLETTP
jgi:hypothetical protein